MYVLLIRLFARVDPIAVDVHGFGQVVDAGLEIFQTHATADEANVSFAVEFHFARTFVVTERAIELRVERLNSFRLLRSLSFTLSLAHIVVC